MNCTPLPHWIFSHSSIFICLYSIRCSSVTPEWTCPQPIFLSHLHKSIYLHQLVAKIFHTLYLCPCFPHYSRSSISKHRIIKSSFKFLKKNTRRRQKPILIHKISLFYARRLHQWDIFLAGARQFMLCENISKNSHGLLNMHALVDFWKTSNRSKWRIIHVCVWFCAIIRANRTNNAFLHFINFS